MREVNRGSNGCADTEHRRPTLSGQTEAGIVFIDLTAAYNTVWHRGFSCKLQRFLSDKHTVRIIMELVQNRSFTLTTGESEQSRLRGLKNSVLQGSILASLLFNI